MRTFVFTGALFCLLGVTADALGAHALEGLLEHTGGSTNFLLATDYMFYHGLGLIAAGIVKGRGCPAPLDLAGWLFVAGSAMFQGNLMAGWLALAAAAIRKKAGRKT